MYQNNTHEAGEPLAHVEATFHFTADAPPAVVGPLFGADRERLWAPDWAPRFVHPPAPADREGMVFTVSSPHGEAVWLNTRFDLDAGVVQYAYVIPGVLATRITLRLAADGERTAVAVTYERTALRVEAGERVRALGRADAAAGPQWAAQINGFLTSTRARSPSSAPPATSAW